MDSRFLECSSPAGFERFECLRSAPVVAGERPPDVLRRLVLFFIRISSVDVLFLLYRKDRLRCSAELKNARTEAGMITRKSLD